jgi:hypothetical protein
MSKLSKLFFHFGIDLFIFGKQLYDWHYYNFSPEKMRTAKAPHEPSQLVSWLELFKLSQAKPWLNWLVAREPAWKELEPVVRLGSKAQASTRLGLKSLSWLVSQIELLYKKRCKTFLYNFILKKNVSQRFIRYFSKNVAKTFFT